MKRQSIAIGIALALAGCATALPDGSRIERLPATEGAATPTLSPEEAKRLEQLNAQVLAEQRAAREREAADEAWRRAQQQWALDLRYGDPGWYGWYGWYGWHGWHGWRRHPRWSFGLGWGPWPY